MLAAASIQHTRARTRTCERKDAPGRSFAGIASRLRFMSILIGTGRPIFRPEVPCMGRVLHLTLTFVLFILMLGPFCEARIVAGVVLPHGDFIAAPSLLPEGKARRAALHLKSAAEGVSSSLTQLEVDLVVLITPHGLTSERDFSFYKDTVAYGYADLGEDLHDPSATLIRINTTVELDTNSTLGLLEALRETGVSNVSYMSAWGGTEGFPLRWGEVIPLLFLEKGNLPSKAGTPLGRKYVIISMPTRRYVELDSMHSELRQLGTSMYLYLESLPQRVAVVISGDLAHTHSSDGPYGFSPAAEPFDLACAGWAAGLRKVSLHVASALVGKALSCGFGGIVILDALLRAGESLTGAASSVDAGRVGVDGGNSEDGVAGRYYRQDGMPSPSSSSVSHQHHFHEGEEEAAAHSDGEEGNRLCGVTWTCRVLGVSHPTYYGMMVASFVRRQQDSTKLSVSIT